MANKSYRTRHRNDKSWHISRLSRIRNAVRLEGKLKIVAGTIDLLQFPNIFVVMVNLSQDVLMIKNNRRVYRLSGERLWLRYLSSLS
ncbi:MAG: hypothetical protein SR3Q1_06995 [Quinella sp. 3Q1]|nr:hypothetical protein [Quinella sp. 3Q1]MBR6887148.1 hypothetical protein [Selenomonadaceae bacterium]